MLSLFGPPCMWLINDDDDNDDKDRTLVSGDLTQIEGDVEAV